MSYGFMASVPWWTVWGFSCSPKAQTVWGLVIVTFRIFTNNRPIAIHNISENYENRINVSPSKILWGTTQREYRKKAFDTMSAESVLVAGSCGGVHSMNSRYLQMSATCYSLSIHEIVSVRVSAQLLAQEVWGEEPEARAVSQSQQPSISLSIHSTPVCPNTEVKIDASMHFP